jgi:tRNA pseudouridine55 synthase
MNPPSLPALPRGGVLNISKPSGLTSFQVVRQVRRILGEKRVGHCGTLDPMASGVLVVVFGSATVLQDQFMAGEKVYRAEMKLGIKTDTGDITGKPLMTCEPPKISTLQIQKAFDKFTGEISQVPPMYSALKRDGKPLYAYARAGVEVHRDPRPVTIHALTLIALRHPVIEFRVVCSKGTYVRTLVEDLGEFLGVPATLSGLVREKVGKFSIDQSLSWEQLAGMGRDELFARSLTA